MVQNTLSYCQIRFRCGRSSTLQLIVSMNNIVDSKNNGIDTLAVFLDLKKAFDKVDRAGLFDELKSRGSVVDCSPQGSTIGSFFFLVYINELPDVSHSVLVNAFLQVHDSENVTTIVCLSKPLANSEEDLKVSPLGCHPTKSKKYCFGGDLHRTNPTEKASM